MAPPLLMFSKGETLRKGGGGIAPNWPRRDTKKTHSAQARGASLGWSRGIAQYGATKPAASFKPSFEP